MAIAAGERKAERVFASERAMEGDGVTIHRAFPAGEVEDLDPFLLLDEMGPMAVKAGEARGFPDHPHRGFETVTYMLDGQMEHRDSRGNHGVLRPGSVQWMTAGAGIVHSEMPGAELASGGGKLHGFQLLRDPRKTERGAKQFLDRLAVRAAPFALWVNLPRKDKMAEPRYQELPGEGIPVGRSEDGRVEARVIAGEALGVAARISTHTPILYLHFTLEPGAEHAQAVPEGANAFAYVIDGAMEAGGERVEEREFVVFERGGGTVRLKNAGEEKLSVLSIAGVPIGEPVARYGPFVMNSREELVAAFEDFRAGRMGRIQKS